MAMRLQTAVQRKRTLEEFYAERDAAPKGVRYEFIDGEVLVTPSPHWSHQRIATEITVRLHAYVKRHSLGEVFVSPLDVLLAPQLVFQPDALVVPNGELKTKKDV